MNYSYRSLQLLGPYCESNDEIEIREATERQGEKSLVKVFELLDQALPEAMLYLDFSVIRTHQFEICFVKLQLRDQIDLGKGKSCESNYSQR